MERNEEHSSMERMVPKSNGAKQDTETRNMKFYPQRFMTIINNE